MTTKYIVSNDPTTIIKEVYDNNGKLIQTMPLTLAQVNTQITNAQAIVTDLTSNALPLFPTQAN